MSLQCPGWLSWVGMFGWADTHIHTGAHDGVLQLETGSARHTHTHTHMHRWLAEWLAGKRAYEQRSLNGCADGYSWPHVVHQALCVHVAVCSSPQQSHVVDQWTSHGISCVCVSQVMSTVTMLT